VRATLTELWYFHEVVDEPARWDPFVGHTREGGTRKQVAPWRRVQARVGHLGRERPELGRAREVLAQVLLSSFSFSNFISCFVSPFYFNLEFEFKSCGEIVLKFVCFEHDIMGWVYFLVNLVSFITSLPFFFSILFPIL
jgi:hypothetical protein